MYTICSICTRRIANSPQGAGEVKIGVKSKQRNYFVMYRGTTPQRLTAPLLDSQRHITVNG